MTPLLELRNVTKVFGGRGFGQHKVVAVDDVTFSISEDSPSMIAVAGESGSGKTTLSRLLLGVDSPTSGQVLYRGKDVRKLSRAERKAFLRDVQPIYQDPFGVYNPFYKAEHLLFAAASKFGLASSKKEARALIAEALETVGLRPNEIFGRFPHQLSGGQRQRVMIARAVIVKPQIILADEPVSMVDASLRATILESLRVLNRELGISVLYVTHDLTTAYQICQNILIMYRGSVVEVGDVDHVIANPQHPYTQLLIDSIPRMRAARDWEQEGNDDVGSTNGASRESFGCKFANRCPHVMEKCWTTTPPLVQVEDHRASACFLHEDAPVSETNDISQWMGITT